MTNGVYFDNIINPSAVRKKKGSGNHHRRAEDEGTDAGHFERTG